MNNIPTFDDGSPGITQDLPEVHASNGEEPQSGRAPQVSNTVERSKKGKPTASRKTSHVRKKQVQIKVPESSTVDISMSEKALQVSKTVERSKKGKPTASRKTSRVRKKRVQIKDPEASTSTVGVARLEGPPHDVESPRMNSNTTHPTKQWIADNAASDRSSIKSEASYISPIQSDVSCISSSTMLNMEKLVPSSNTPLMNSFADGSKKIESPVAVPTDASSSKLGGSKGKRPFLRMTVGCTSEDPAAREDGHAEGEDKVNTSQGKFPKRRSTYSVVPTVRKIIHHMSLRSRDVATRSGRRGRSETTRKSERKVNIANKKKKRTRKPSRRYKNDGVEYEVDRILEEKKIGNQTYYLILWKGYKHSEQTWEPESYVDVCPTVLKDFTVLKRLRAYKDVTSSEVSPATNSRPPIEIQEMRLEEDGGRYYIVKIGEDREKIRCDVMERDFPELINQLFFPGQYNAWVVGQSGLVQKTL